MKKISLLLFSSLFLICLLGSCGGNKQKTSKEEAAKPKTLVLYYSQTGTTRQVAEEIQRQLGADIDSIVPEVAYGYDYDATIQRWKHESEDSVKVAIKPLTRSVNEYDTIFLGFPIWGGTFASPVASWLDDNKPAGKTIITFATFGSGGIERATSDVAELQPASNVIEGYGVRSARIAKSPVEIARFLLEKGFKSGGIEKLPEYGPSAIPTPEEIEIFNLACGDYKFPLGSPIGVALRSYDEAVDYKFDVKSQSPDGHESSSVIYVTVIPGEKPEFTRVVRK